MTSPSRADLEAQVRSGIALLRAGRLDEAGRVYQEVLATEPHHPAANHHLGLIAGQRNQLDESARLLQLAVDAVPGDPVAQANLGEILRRLGRFESAVSAFRSALAVDPFNVVTHTNYGITLLAMGDYAQGWAEYEWSVRGNPVTGVAPLPTFGVPRYVPGGAFTGKKVLLYDDQGLGDAIQFVRYAALVSAGGSQVLLRCRPPLAGLFRTVWGVERVLTTDEPVPPIDAHCPLHSLPFTFGTTLESIPNAVPYLDPDPAAARRWSMMLPNQTTQLRVGLVWAGSPGNMHDRQRSLTPDQLAPLGQVPGIQWVLLQKRAAGSEFADGKPAFPAIDLGDELTDFADTAALLANLDLLIAVDTSTAHLAGALGKPVWMLLAAVPDWRWLSETPTTPWYPSARLFRQKTAGDWDAVIQEVGAALTATGRNRRLLGARV